MSLSLAVVIAVFSTGSPGADHNLALSQTASIVGVVAINLYIISFGVSWGPVVWVLLSEMFPNKLRGAATWPSPEPFSGWPISW